MRLVVPAAPAAAAVGGWSALGWYLIRAALDLARGAPPHGGVAPVAEPVHELASGGEEEEAEALSVAQACPLCPDCPAAAPCPACEPEPVCPAAVACLSPQAFPACGPALVSAAASCVEQAQEHDAVFWATGSAGFGLVVQALLARLCRRRAPVRRAPRQAASSGSG